MKAIKITPEKTDAIEAALAAVNGRATAFTITAFREVERAAQDAEDKLAALPKADRTGARASFVPSGPSANSYKYRAASTKIGLIRRAGGWYLDAIASAEVHPKSPARLTVTITEAQRDEIARRAVADFHVAKSEQPA